MSEFYLKKSLTLCDFDGLLTSSLWETGQSNGLASNKTEKLGSKLCIACSLYLSETKPDDNHTNSILGNGQRDALFLNVFILCLYMLHVSSSKCSSSGGPNCINTSSGITHSGRWLSAVPVKTGMSDSHPPECVIPDDVLIQFGPPDNEHLLLESCRDIK
jgi:hypothetical protein